MKNVFDLQFSMQHKKKSAENEFREVFGDILVLLLATRNQNYLKVGAKHLL
jgi:hypothetical protein